MSSSLLQRKGNLIIRHNFYSFLLILMPTHSLSIAEARNKSLFNAFPKIPWKIFNDREELYATLIFPENHTSESEAPAALFFHGGLWKMGDRTEFAPWALHLAKQGFVCILMEYRQIQKFQVNAEDIIDDAFESWNWLQKNAQLLGINPQKILASGSDAGGLLALLLGMLPNELHPIKILEPRPAALAVFRGLIDIPDSKTTIASLFPSTKMAKKFSPNQLITKNLPPLFLATGGKDKLFPHEPISKFAKNYSKKKNSITYLLLEECDSSFYHFNMNTPIFEYTLINLLHFLRENSFITKDISSDEIELIL